MPGERDGREMPVEDCNNTIFKTGQFNESKSIEQHLANFSYSITTFIVS